MSGREFFEKMEKGEIRIPKGETCDSCGDRLIDGEFHIVYGISRGVIRITKTPAGEMPEHLRMQWLGVELPYIAFDPNDNASFGLDTGKLSPTHPRYIVRQPEAIEVVKKVRPEIAEWCKQQGLPHENMCFSFRAEEVEVVVPLKS